MSFNVGKTVYDSPEECLRDVTRMIRVGFPLDEEVPDQKKRIGDTISALKNELKRKPALTPTDQLRLLTLEAEFYQQCGRHVRSAQILEPVWNKLKPKLDQWSAARPLEPSGDRELLRQKIWALMHYVFYDYRISGQHKQALSRFLRIEEIIHSELEHADHHPFGTLAVCNYFVGLCYRVDRGFVEAERRMLAAQKYTYERVMRQMSRTDISPERKKYELNYKDLICARILSGQGWIALQQGQLLRAEQILRTAQNCLVQTRQETISVYIDSLLCMAVRRQTAYKSAAYEQSLADLIEAHDRAVGVHELIRQRCAFELVRGYLDFAEFGTNDKHVRKDYISWARQWLEKVGEVPIPKSEHRFHLHEIRLLIVKGDFDLADAKLHELRKLVFRSNAPRQRAFYILEAVLYFAQKEFDNASDAVKNALKEILPLSEGEIIREYRIPDPVLEAECYVLLARICAAKKDYPGARHYLGRWRLLSQFVENYYLHHLARQVSTTENPFFLSYDYPIYDNTKRVRQTILERRDEFERWLVYNAHERNPDLKPKDLADIYGLDRSTLVRNFPELFSKKSRQDRE